MGFKTFRFSISWARILPHSDDGNPNEKGIQFYENVIDELIKYGIEPLVTISHYEFSLALSKKKNGCGSRKTIDDFVHYCEILFNRYEEKVKYWITFNEMNVIGITGYLSGRLFLENSKHPENPQQDITKWLQVQKSLSFYTKLIMMLK